MSLGDTFKGWRSTFMENFGTRYKTTMLKFKSTQVYRTWEIKKSYQEIYQELHTA